jgi:penicillin-binding protein 2
MPEFRFVLFMIMLLMSTACSALPDFSGASQSGEAGSVILQQTGRSPEETVQTFLDAWNAEDFQTMYGLISPRSAQVYPLDQFSEQYETTDTELRFAGVTYTIHNVELQGNSAAVTYDLTLNSNTFGEINDQGRIMRLVQQDGGWQIAWTPMDIINGMTSTVRVQADRRFPPRGNIYDRSGQLLVDQNGSTLAILLSEQDMSSEDDCIAVLAEAMLRPVSYFRRLFLDYSPETLFFAGEITPDRYSRYQNDLNNNCGLSIDDAFFGSKVRQTTGRSYYGNGAAAHITGYIGSVPADRLQEWVARGYSARDVVGLAGVELTYQDQLAGTPEQVLRLIDSSGIALRELGGATGSEPVSLQLTIDRNLQMAMAAAFNDAWNYSTNNWGGLATGGAGAVIDVNTGAVLAMFSFPTYDPRIFNGESWYYSTQTVYASAGQQIARAASADQFLPVGPALANRALSEQYPPGSTFKIVTELAAADTRTWTPDQIFNCSLTWSGRAYGDALELREDWRVSLGWEAAGEIPMTTALATSCNPFFWEVGALMYQRNRSIVADYARMLGLGARTGLQGLGVEANGNIPNPEDITSALNNAIGQGNTQVTALQMARLVATIANDGTLYRPYIVQQIGGFNDEEIVQRIEPEILATLSLQPDSIAIVQQGMCATTTDRDYGTSYFVFEDAPYSSCGKTGTAQTGAVAPHSWYVAYAPADNPQVAIAVVVTNSREGSEVAAPIVRRVLDSYFSAPIAPFPDWWQEEYVPLVPPQGVSGGTG